MYELNYVTSFFITSDYCFQHSRSLLNKTKIRLRRGTSQVKRHDKMDELYLRTAPTKLRYYLLLYKFEFIANNTKIFKKNFNIMQQRLEERYQTSKEKKTTYLTSSHISLRHRKSSSNFMDYCVSARP